MNYQVDSRAIMTAFVDFHMQDSGQFSIKTKKTANLQLSVSFMSRMQQLYRFVRKRAEGDIE